MRDGRGEQTTWSNEAAPCDQCLSGSRFRQVHQRGRRPNPVDRAEAQREMTHVCPDQGQGRSSSARMGEQGGGSIDSDDEISSFLEIRRIASAAASKIDEDGSLRQTSQPDDQQRRPCMPPSLPPREAFPRRAFIDGLGQQNHSRCVIVKTSTGRHLRHEPPQCIPRSDRRHRHGIHHQTIDGKTSPAIDRPNGQRVIAHKSSALDLSKLRPAEFNSSRPTRIGALKCTASAMESDDRLSNTLISSLNATVSAP